jgi:prolyl oligopeptidase
MAPNGRVLAIDLADAARERWREVVPEGRAVIKEIALARGRIVAHTVGDLASRLRVYAADGRLEGELPLPAPGTVSMLQGSWEGEELLFQFSSMTIPATITRVDPATRRGSEWWRSRVPIDARDFEVERAWFPSRDGTRVPMFLLRRKGLTPDGERPVLLYGYGGFRQTMQPAFRADAARWAEMGGVFAIVGLRGGSEFGEAWHAAGMLANKQNTFDDFVAAAEWLVARRWTRPSKLAMMGGSNGGLLVGAVMTQRPDLFRAVACSVPLLDMLRYHRFLVARFWVPEYGSADDPEQFEWLRAYSPYHHVTPGVKYPAVLFVTGDSDTRVAPLHARKMTARLQAASASGHPILLHYDTRAGHSSGKPIGRTIEDETDRLLFLAWQLGIGAEAIGRPARGAAPSTREAVGASTRRR